MVVGAGIVSCAGGLVVIALDDFLGEFAGGFDCASGGTENEEYEGAFWAVFGGGVCDCVGAGELFAAVVAGEFLDVRC